MSSFHKFDIWREPSYLYKSPFELILKLTKRKLTITFLVNFIIKRAEKGTVKIPRKRRLLQQRLNTFYFLFS